MYSMTNGNNSIMTGENRISVSYCNGPKFWDTKNNQFSIWNKLKIDYFLVSQYFSTLYFILSNLSMILPLNCMFSGHLIQKVLSTIKILKIGTLSRKPLLL